MGGDPRSFLYTIGAFFTFNLIGIIFCMFVKNSMTEFVLHLAVEHDFAQNVLGDPMAATLNPNPKPKEKKNIEIPEFLFKYSSTFFKTATKKDVLFKKLFSPDKGFTKRLPQAGKSASERFTAQNQHAKTPDPVTSSKALKKTDLSMANFHLDVKANEELMKHYR